MSNDATTPRCPIAREIERMRGYAISGTYSGIDEAAAELARLRKIEAAAELACGILFLAHRCESNAIAAFRALCDAIGGRSSPGLTSAIRRALSAGYTIRHPSGADWWADKTTEEDPGPAVCPIGAPLQCQGTAVGGDWVMISRARLEELEALELAVSAGETLAQHTGSDSHRQWGACGTWLYPGDRVVLISDHATLCVTFSRGRHEL